MVQIKIPNMYYELSVGHIIRKEDKYLSAWYSKKSGISLKWENVTKIYKIDRDKVTNNDFIIRKLENHGPYRRVIQKIAEKHRRK